MAGRGLNLNNFAESFTENASRLGARIQESFSEHTRDLGRSPNSAYLDATEEKVRHVRKHLDSNSDREKLDGLKTLIALISRGRNVSEFFPYVVKNVASQNLEVRKLVYIYLLRYAESEPDLALLSINTFQKDLTDYNPLIRSMALRVLSGINVPMIATIVVMSVKKCAGDTSPYVRKAAAFAVIKCYQMDSGQLPSLISIMELLLRDRSPLSIGAVADAFQEVCPTRFNLLHKHYRRLCRMLTDVDAWGQVSLLELLARYARSMLSRPSIEQNEDEGKADVVDPDLQLLLKCCEPLFMSQNPAVVLAAARIFFYLGPDSQRNKIVSPLLRLLHQSAGIERVVLSYLTTVIRNLPEAFIPYYSSFLVKATDTTKVKQDKLRILIMLLSVDNFQALLREFVVYANDNDEEFVADSVKAIGRCARVIPDSAPHCVSALMEFIKHGSDTAISSSVLVLKTLVQSHMQAEQPVVSASNYPNSPLRIVGELAARIEEVKHPAARACIIWLVGQYSEAPPDQVNHGISGIATWAPDVLRRVAKSFASEKPIVKLQVCTLATKLLTLAPTHHMLIRLVRYVFSLARYDADYDVRDRARMLGMLLHGVSSEFRLMNGSIEDAEEVTDKGGVVLRREQVRLVVFDGKLQTPEETKSPGGESDVLGSLETVTGRPMSLGSTRRLPDWPEEGTDSSLRDAEDEYPAAPPTSIASRAVGFGSSPKVGSPASRTPVGDPSPQGSLYNSRSSEPNAPKSTWKDLDEFLDDAGEEEEESETEESEEESEEGSESDGSEDDNEHDEKGGSTLGVHEEQADGEDDTESDDDSISRSSRQ